jgi:hypothetical protein
MILGAIFRKSSSAPSCRMKKPLTSMESLGVGSFGELGRQAPRMLSLAAPTTLIISLGLATSTSSRIHLSHLTPHIPAAPLHPLRRGQLVGCGRWAFVSLILAYCSTVSCSDVIRWPFKSLRMGSFVGRVGCARYLFFQVWLYPSLPMLIQLIVAAVTPQR